MTPVAVGTQGTVGSLVRKEIEYFSKAEPSDRRRPEKRPPQAQCLDVGSDSGRCKSQTSRPGGFWFMGLSWTRKKLRVAGGFRSSVFAAPDVADVNGSNGIRGFNYVNLRDESENFQS